MLGYVLPLVVFLLSAGSLFRPEFAHRKALRRMAGLFALASGIFFVRELVEVAAPWVRNIQSGIERSGANPGAVARVRDTVPVGDGACAGVRRHLALDRRWVSINDGTCRVAFEVASGDVVFDSAGGERIVGADDPWARSFAIEGIPRVRALSGNAQLTYALCPPDTAGRRVKLDCSPE